MNAFVLAICLALPVAALAAEEHHAHTHGLGSLEIAVLGKAVQGRFEIPMESLLGHEYLPRTPGQKKALSELQAGVSKTSYFFKFPLVAECKEKSITAEAAMFQGKKVEHSDLEVTFESVCENPLALTHIELTIFSKHPRLSSLNVELVSNKVQKSMTIKAKDPVLRW